MSWYATRGCMMQALRYRRSEFKGGIVGLLMGIALTAGISLGTGLASLPQLQPQTDTSTDAGAQASLERAPQMGAAYAVARDGRQIGPGEGLNFVAGQTFSATGDGQGRNPDGSLAGQRDVQVSSSVSLEPSQVGRGNLLRQIGPGEGLNNVGGQTSSAAGDSQGTNEVDSSAGQRDVRAANPHP